MIPIKPNLMYENGYIIMASYFPDAAADDGERERGNKIIIISFHGSLLKKSSTAIKLVFRRNWIMESIRDVFLLQRPPSTAKEEVNFLLLTHSYHLTVLFVTCRH